MHRDRPGRTLALTPARAAARLPVWCALGLCLLVPAACTGSSSPSGTASTGPSISGGSASSAVSTPSGPSASSSSRSPLPTRDPAPLSTVPTRPVRTLPAVPLRSGAPFGTGVTARVTAVSHGTDRDRGPGAATGRPTVEFHLELVNGTKRSVALSAVQVSAAYGADSTPATPADSGTSPFTGRVAAGASATAVYAFAVPSAAQGRIELSVTYDAGVPTVLLTGSAR